MSRGNSIIISSNPGGTFIEGIIGAGLTPKPGTIMQMQLATALVGGRFTFELYNADADGDQRTIFVLLEDDLQGKLMTTAYAAGDRCKLYVPKAGEELNVLLVDVVGTGDDHTIGELLIVDDSTGKLIATTGTPESEPFQLLETITDPEADQQIGRASCRERV
jgi:hypothetical protein